MEVCKKLASAGGKLLAKSERHAQKAAELRSNSTRWERKSDFPNAVRMDPELPRDIWLQNLISGLQGKS